jgi:hypothetical protein
MALGPWSCARPQPLAGEEFLFILNALILFYVYFYEFGCEIPYNMLMQVVFVSYLFLDNLNV